MTTTRDRLLDAAAELLYRDGVHIGVEALCRTAGVSKRSMYQLFGSKDEVLAASLVRRAPDYERALFPGPQAALVELKHPAHPASEVARAVKGRLTEAFRALAEQGGAGDPRLLARQLTLVFDGASARAGAGVETLDGLVTTTVTALLDAAGVA